jgi:1-acyl-sn-glycerol-3-phosphate acyltransferase
MKHLFYRSVRLLLRVCFALFFRHKTYGREHIPVGKALIVANHASFLDPPLLAVSFPEEVHFLARPSLFTRYGLAFLIRHLNAHPLPPKGTTAFKTTLALLNDGYKIVLFPEGARTHNGDILPIKGGFGKLATTSNTPIIPVYIAGTFAAWPPDQKLPHPGHTACIIGSPIYPEKSGSNARDKEILLAATLELRWQQLKSWHHQGAHGPPP